MPSFLSTVIFPGLSCTLTAKGVCAELGLGPGRGQSQPGRASSLPEGGRHMVISDIGSLGCWVVCATLVLPTRPSGFWGALAMLTSPNPRETQPSPGMLVMCDPESHFCSDLR